MDCLGSALIATFPVLRLFRIMLTSILYLQRERSLAVVSGILIARADSPAAICTHVRTRMFDLCVLPSEFIGSQRVSERERERRSCARGNDDSSAGRSPRGVNEAKVAQSRPLWSSLVNQRRSLNFPSAPRNSQLPVPSGSTGARPFIFVSRDCNRWSSRFLFNARKRGPAAEQSLRRRGATGSAENEGEFMGIG